MPPHNLSSEDQSYIKLYLLLPLILSAFERDKKIAEKVFKTPRPYINMIESAMRKVDADLKEVRKRFRELGLKVYEEQRTDDFIIAKYLCRGYHYDMTLNVKLVVAESSVLMEKYLGLDIMKYINTSVPGGKEKYDVPSDKLFDKVKQR